VAHSDQQRDKNEAFGSCSDSKLGWALQKPGSQAVRCTDEVKEFPTTRFDLGGRTGNKADPGKVDADLRTSRKPDGLQVFERKDWLTKSQVKRFFSRLVATRRRHGDEEVQAEDAYAEEEENTARPTPTPCQTGCLWSCSGEKVRRQLGLTDQFRLSKKQRKDFFLSEILSINSMHTCIAR